MNDAMECSHRGPTGESFSIFIFPCFIYENSIYVVYVEYISSIVLLKIFDKQQEGEVGDVVDKTYPHMTSFFQLWHLCGS